jgi:hypothetical protein
MQWMRPRDCGRFGGSPDLAQTACMVQAVVFLSTAAQITVSPIKLLPNQPSPKSIPPQINFVVVNVMVEI